MKIVFSKLNQILEEKMDIQRRIIETKEKYVRDKDVTRLIHLGGQLLKEGYYMQSFEIYKLAKDGAGLAACTDAFFKSGMYDLAEESHQLHSAEKIPRYRYVKKALHCAERGLLDEVQKIYATLQIDVPKNMIVLCRDAHIHMGFLEKAEEISLLLGSHLSSDQIIKCGDACLMLGWILRAQEAYKYAGIKIPPDKLIKCGELLIRRTNFASARKAYKLANVEFPINKVVESGDYWFKKGWWNMDMALDAYIVAKDQKRLLACGFAFLDTGDLFLAKIAYAAAGEKIPLNYLLSYGNTCTKIGRLDELIESYKLAGMGIPPHKFMECGDARKNSGTIKKGPRDHKDISTQDNSNKWLNAIITFTLSDDTGDESFQASFH